MITDDGHKYKDVIPKTKSNHRNGSPQIWIT